MWPFKWKLSTCTFTWCYLFVKILENEIWKFGRNLPLATFGSERVKEEKRIWSPESTEKILSFMRESNPWPIKCYWVTGILCRAVWNPYLMFFSCSQMRYSSWLTSKRNSYKEIFVITIDDQSDGSIKIFLLIDYEIAGNSHQHVTVLLPFFSNISARQAVGLFRFTCTLIHDGRVWEY